MKRLRDGEFQDALLRLPRRDRSFVRATEYEDTVSSVPMLRDSDGKAYKPEDYLAAFSRYVQENEDRITAIRILLDRPRDWSAIALSELKQKLAATRQRFTVDNLQRAHEMRHRKALVDIISMVKHAAREESPLLTSAERAARAFQKVTQGQTFTPDQQAWLDRIRTVMQANLARASPTSRRALLRQDDAWSFSTGYTARTVAVAPWRLTSSRAGRPLA